jgi:hypothetical protein
MPHANRPRRASGAAGLPETPDGAGYPVRDPLPDKPGSSGAAGPGAGSCPPARSSPRRCATSPAFYMIPPETAPGAVRRGEEPRACRCCPHPGADDARLRAQRHPKPARRARRGQRPGDRPVLPAAPPPGVPALPQAHRQRRARRPGPAPDPRRLRHAQGPGRRQAAAAAPAVPPALHASWTNVAERWFAELTNRKLGRSAHRDDAEPEAGLRNWVIERNRDPEPFAWARTADEIPGNLALLPPG